MRLARAEVGGRVVSGVLRPGDAGPDGVGTFHPLPGGRTVDDLVRSGLAAALEVGGEALASAGIPPAGLRLLAPVEPVSVRDFVTFEEHVEGVRRSVDGVGVGDGGVAEAWYDAPAFYFTNPHAVVGPGAPVARPAGCRALDFELEVAAVLGAGGTSLTEAAAHEAIFGYLVLNDWSARDLQAREMQVGLGPAKGKDFCTSLGPWLVTADELADAHDADGFLDLDCRVEVNGVLVGRDRLSHMGWRFATMVAYASRDSRVLPGDVLASGTTGGGGCLAELWGRTGSRTPPALEPGDVVSITVERLGTLSNPVVAGAAWPPLSPFRPRASESRS